MVEAVIEAAKAGKRNGHARSTGYDATRTVFAKFYDLPESSIPKDDVPFAIGYSGALDLAIGALADEGSNTLAPAPGYKTLASAKEAECQSYRYLPEIDREIGLANLEQLVDTEAGAIVMTSSSCGSSFSKAHVEALVKAAERLKVAIIADEMECDIRVLRINI